MRITCANWSRRHAGGVESYLEFVIPALQSLGHDLSFWSERDRPAERRPVHLPANVASWCADLHGLDQSLTALRNWSPSVVFVHGLEAPDVEERLVHIAPGVMLAHSYYGTCISGGKTTRFPSDRPCSRAFGPACLAHFYPRRCGGLSPLTMLRDYRRQARRLALLSRYEAVLTLSEHMRREYLQHGAGEQRVRRLPPYLPAGGSRTTDSVSADPGVRSIAGLDGSRGAGRTTTLCFLGRIDPLKGLDVAIDALAHVHSATASPVHLIAAGDGPDRGRCEQLAAAVRREGFVDVTFTGWLDRTARQQLLSQADVLVFPSLWPEPYGLAGLEAVVAGLPVAAFRSGGVAEWLRDGVDGALAAADPPSAAGLADAIVRSIRAGRQAPWSEAAIADTQRRHLDALVSHLSGAAAVRPGLVVA